MLRPNQLQYTAPLSLAHSVIMVAYTQVSLLLHDFKSLPPPVAHFPMYRWRWKVIGLYVNQVSISPKPIHNCLFSVIMHTNKQTCMITQPSSLSTVIKGNWWVGWINQNDTRHSNYLAMTGMLSASATAAITSSWLPLLGRSSRVRPWTAIADTPQLSISCASCTVPAVC